MLRNIVKWLSWSKPRARSRAMSSGFAATNGATRASRSSAAPSRTRASAAGRLGRHGMPAVADDDTMMASTPNPISTATEIGSNWIPCILATIPIAERDAIEKSITLTARSRAIGARATMADPARSAIQGIPASTASAEIDPAAMTAGRGRAGRPSPGTERPGSSRDRRRRVDPATVVHGDPHHRQRIRDPRPAECDFTPATPATSGPRAPGAPSSPRAPSPG